MYALKWRSLWLSYIACGALGIFVNAYMPVGFELAMELTFPMEESTTSGILMAMTQLLGTPFAVIAGIINKSIGGFLTIGVLSAIMLLGTIITAFIPNKLLRQQAFNNNSDLRKESHHGSRLVYIP
ncbi:hypothetical protein NQ318_011923 [Aromia moschata]|uniref:Major facilitator superfamily (MFS) profile domain-containing protein n=1 Tax=Aromia moschata TaxID=1265417 RepID=A0AAV8XHZ1_9CUCU|nr:hypothetical protein NQ318_011923 [Aromia moschata]